ncbi:hypothetical protein JCM17961_45220 [Endothiovibrio diazotrophicus]
MGTANPPHGWGDVFFPRPQPSTCFNPMNATRSSYAPCPMTDFDGREVEIRRA